MKWPELNGSHDPADVLIQFEDVDEFVDPIIVVADLGDMDPATWRVEGIQVHVCEWAEPGKLYVVDRPHIVDGEGLCLVCGRDTYPTGSAESGDEVQPES